MCMFLTYIAIIDVLKSHFSLDSITTKSSEEIERFIQGYLAPYDISKTSCEMTQRVVYA